MAKLKITTPVGDYNGFCGNVEFVQGIGYADQDTHAAEIAYMRANGYTVEGDEGGIEDSASDGEQPADEAPAQPSAPPPPGGDDKMPARNGSADAWRTYAVDHGMDPDEAAELSRDQLVERFTTSKEDPK